jgi:hypothetical protein
MGQNGDRGVVFVLVDVGSSHAVHRWAHGPIQVASGVSFEAGHLYACGNRVLADRAQVLAWSVRAGNGIERLQRSVPHAGAVIGPRNRRPKIEGAGLPDGLQDRSRPGRGRFRNELASDTGKKRDGDPSRTPWPFERLPEHPFAEPFLEGSTPTVRRVVANGGAVRGLVRCFRPSVSISAATRE